MGSKLKKWRTGIDSVGIYPSPPRRMSTSESIWYLISNWSNDWMSIAIERIPSIAKVKLIKWLTFNHLIKWYEMIECQPLSTFAIECIRSCPRYRPSLSPFIWMNVDGYRHALSYGYIHVYVYHFVYKCCSDISIHSNILICICVYIHIAIYMNECQSPSTCALARIRWHSLSPFIWMSTTHTTEIRIHSDMYVNVYTTTFFM